jgi:hypothetical protein
MSMTPDSENFEQLRKLMALKRHEVPPPGYFHGFSRQVIVRIKAGELGEEAGSTWWILEGSWLRRIWGGFEARPILGGAFGVAVCGFFVAGALISADNPEVGGVGVVQAAGPLPSMASASAPAEVTPLQSVAQQFPSSPTPLADSLFDRAGQLGRIQAVPVVFPTTAPVGGN